MIIRLLSKIFQPKTIEMLDYIASYKGQWADGGIPVEVLEKKYPKQLISNLLDKNYLKIEDESIGVVVGDYAPTHKVYHLDQNALKRVSPPLKDKKNSGNQWGWWVMGIVGSVMAGLILAYVFGVGK